MRSIVSSGMGGRPELEERIGKARSCREKVEAAKAAASFGPDDKQMEKLRVLLTALTTARALRDSTATRVTMRYVPNREGGVLHAGQALADGKELAIHKDAVLHLEGLGELTVHPGEGPAGLGSVSQAETDLAEALATLGVSSVEEAARAHQKRQDAKSELLQLEAEFRGHAPKGIEDLQKQIAALPDAMTQDIEELPPLDEAEVQLQSASRMVLELRARMNAARDQRDEARTVHTTALVRKEEAERQLNSAIEALGRLAQQDEDALAAVAAQADEKRLAAVGVLADTLLPQSLIRNGQEETVDILSGGTQEQIALLVRLAFARLLSKDGRHAPVILDDALVFTDDDRIERMFDALHRQASDLQIIVLSCRQRAFRDLGGKTLRLESTCQ